ncbi:MAG: hypothetical protein LC732_10200, partial [Acidobacteria bacterium]|nr:hypothetical protein [Acidobacteriota bacterium]
RWAVANGIDLAQGASSWPIVLQWVADTRAVQLGLLNPAVTATYGLLSSAAIAGAGLALAALIRKPDSGSEPSPIAP